MTDVFGFFYIIVTEGTGRIGFGITKSCFDRIDDYIAHTGMPKTSFKYLFWGQYDDIVKIEKDFKKLNRGQLLTVVRRRGRWKMEWLDSEKSTMTEDDIRTWVIDYIKKHNKEVRPLKSKWLPYRGDPVVQTANISYDKEDYLEDTI
jgi:hypothetical protein